MRKFEKISLEEFSKYYDRSLYAEYSLPKRMSQNSAGYDFFAIEDLTVTKNRFRPRA